MSNNSSASFVISQALIQQAISWRQQLHANPELGFDEHTTAKFIADTLSQFGLQVHTGIAGTGVVGVLKKGVSTRSIGIRADIDALPMTELNDFAHASCVSGRMHACGHDGHAAILLAAAAHLAQHGQFDGTVYFIFQPAEENLGGGQAMIDDGLFERFEIDEVYGLHNWPGRTLGEICVNDGVMMGSFDIFDIVLTGKGGHAAMPEGTCDPIVAAAALILHAQSIIARKVSPLDSAVLSITQIDGGDTYNIIPETVRLKGTVRALDENVRQTVKSKLIQAVKELPALHGVAGEIDYQERYPATINNADCARHIRQVATELFGADKVSQNVLPTMASEDFSFMLNAKKGAYVWLGVDEADRPSKPLHNPYYDFNDNAIAIGANLWVGLVERTLG
ncbi:peptidase M20 [Moraxella caviae]|uniref:N-acetyldiaminopimelate deacetylase n=1 Tax=Moraxella caviae TaxID=34060 RepID=A0A1T0A1U6_9GAMM|nr:M20 aminoacylase family protein [Moraxella caviae]OOR89628.1 peptidase M20 [Moraxella caviae]STZ10316.1 N-acetyldiaminopimelate deacetylase [Moraxella caviae]VEW12642.1 N-acetyldiaminopimelate deacetylase [Moraxella caviae]